MLGRGCKLDILGRDAIDVRSLPIFKCGHVLLYAILCYWLQGLPTRGEVLEEVSDLEVALVLLIEGLILRGCSKVVVVIGP